ncbi:MAG: hypothetical protein JOY71_29675 [Acetobacteraceae bacterium]|nr:hypothetical protein [Acetobacteraceae bacterium]
MPNTDFGPGLGGLAEPSPTDARDAPASGQFLASSYSNEAGTRGYKLYVPSGYRGQPLPLIVMLHGCTQSPDDFAAGTRMRQELRPALKPQRLRFRGQRQRNLNLNRSARAAKSRVPYSVRALLRFGRRSKAARFRQRTSNRFPDMPHHERPGPPSCSVAGFPELSGRGRHQREP